MMTDQSSISKPAPPIEVTGNESLKRPTLKNGAATAASSLSNGVFNKSLSLKFDDSVNIGDASTAKKFNDKSNPVPSLSLEKSSSKAKSVHSFSLNGFSFKKKQSHQIVDHNSSELNKPAAATGGAELLIAPLQDEAEVAPVLPTKLTGSLKKMVDSSTDSTRNSKGEVSKQTESGASLHKLANNNESSKDNVAVEAVEETDPDKLGRKKKEKKVKLKSVEFLNTSTPSKYDQDQSKLSLIENQSNMGDSCSNKSSSSRLKMSMKNCWDYSYVVLFASFVAYMLASLLGSCFGVFFESMDSDLGWSKSQVAFIGACLTALQDLTGPIASAVTNKYGCRKTCIFGGLIASVSIIAASYIEEFWLFSLLMGGFSGFGTSLVLVSSVVVVTYYFEEKPSFAAGLTISGASFGQSIFTMILIKLNNTYGRNGCFLILGGILLNMVVCGALFRPLAWELEDEEEGDDEDDEEDDEGDEEEEELEDDVGGEVKKIKEDGSPSDSKQLVPVAKKKPTLVTEDEKPLKEKEPTTTKADKNNLITLKSVEKNALQAPLADKEFYESFSDYLSSLNDYNLETYRRNSSGNRSINPDDDGLLRNQNDDELVALLQEEDFYENQGPYLQLGSEKNFSLIEMPRLGRSNSVFHQDQKNSNQNDDPAADASQQLINVVDELTGNQMKISRRHSVHIDSEAHNSKKKGSLSNIGASFIPTDTQSLKLFSSSDPDLREQPFSMPFKDPRARGENHRRDDENMASNQQISLQNGEFVVINADDIKSYGSNLMITSPDGEIFLPIISNFDENNNFLGSMGQMGMSSPRLDRHHSNQEGGANEEDNLYQDYPNDNDDNLYSYIQRGQTTSATDLRDRRHEFEYATNSLEKEMHELGGGPDLERSSIQSKRSLNEEETAEFGNLNTTNNEFAGMLSQEVLSKSQNDVTDIDIDNKEPIAKESSSKIMETNSAAQAMMNEPKTLKRSPNLLTSILNRLKLGNLVSKAPASPSTTTSPKLVPSQAAITTVPSKKNQSRETTPNVSELRKPAEKLLRQHQQLLVLAPPGHSIPPSSQTTSQIKMAVSSRAANMPQNFNKIKVITLNNNQKLAYPAVNLASNLVGLNAPPSHKVLKHTLYENAYGPKVQKKTLLLNRCNCHQRHLQQHQANLNKKHQRTRSGNIIDPSSSKMNLGGASAADSAHQPAAFLSNVNTLVASNSQQTSIQLENKHVQQEQLNAGAAHTSGGSSTNPANRPINPKSAHKPFRHYPNCPYHYLNQGANNPTNLKANMYYVPNLFQNSYRFPLHFKNVYYYKSLVNLNMRLMVVKPHHGSQSAALGGVVNLNNANKANTSGLNSEELANISLSCPDLARRQLLIMNSQNKVNNNLTAQISPQAHEPAHINFNNKQHQVQVITLKDLRLLTQQQNRRSAEHGHPSANIGAGRSGRYVILGNKNNANNKTYIITKNSSLNRMNVNRRDYNNLYPASKRPMSQGAQKMNFGLNNKQQHLGSHHQPRSNNRFYYMSNINDMNNQNSNLKVLNAGSIVLTTNAATGSTNKLRRDSVVRRRPFDPSKNLFIIENEKIKPADLLIKPNQTDNLETKIIGARMPKQPKYQRQRSSVGVDDELIEYSDKIVPEAKNKDEVFFDKEPATENDDEEDEDDEEDDEDDEEEDDEEEDEEEDDEEDDEEEEECDNCFTRTKCGNYLYRYLIRPIYKPLKYIGYSIVENLKLFRLFRFCIFALCNFILSLFYESPFYFINSYMTKNELTENQAGTVTVAIGIVSVFSSIAYGYIGDSKRVNSIILYSVSLILCGLCSCAIPLFIKNYWVTMLLMVLIGALISVSDVLVPIICVNIVGYDDFVNAYGLMFFCQGLASLSGPPILGFIVDHYGSYGIAYYIIGIGICFSGLILTLILFYNQCENKKKTKSLVSIATDKELSSNEKA